MMKVIDRKQNRKKNFCVLKEIKLARKKIIT